MGRRASGGRAYEAAPARGGAKSNSERRAGVRRDTTYGMLSIGIAANRKGRVATMTPSDIPTGQDTSTGRPRPSNGMRTEEMEYVLAGIGPRRQAFNSTLVRLSDGASEWLRKHWLAVVNGVLAAWIGVAVLAPVGYALGFTGPASAVFRAYRFACDQIPSHSFFIGGFQICLCARCLAIYSSMLIAGIALNFLRKRRSIQAFTWWMWMLAILPMALDGGTQFFGWRESNVWLRLLTGIIFGIGTAWFTLPQLEASARAEFAPAHR
ncbi:MAG TPA: DUF2085 domain-containing protein [Ktedonobacterales bacterium]|nr:DUF2085 domain-containing protein [Ktedonobacterales bacterium]